MGKARLIYVMGPSGSGKDSLLEYLRGKGGDTAYLIAHRYITRPFDAGGENHIAVSQNEFDLLRERDCLALFWQSHGNSYGVGREVDLWMAAGIPVVMNGSRGYFPEALTRYPDLVPVLVQVETDVLVQRLKRRGRESEQEVRHRLERSQAMDVAHPDLRVVDNSGPLASAGEALHAVVHSVVAGA